MIVRVSVRIVVTEYQPGLCRECVDVHNGQRLSITLETAGYVSLAGSPLTPLDCGLG